MVTVPSGGVNNSLIFQISGSNGSISGSPITTDTNQSIFSKKWGKRREGVRVKTRKVRAEGKQY